MYSLNTLRCTALSNAICAISGGINDTIITPYPRLRGAADGIKGVGAPIIDDSHDVLTSTRGRAFSPWRNGWL